MPNSATNMGRVWGLILNLYTRFGLRLASGESGADGGEKRLANRSRSATPVAEPQTEARRFCGSAICKLVTSVRFAKWNGRGREG